MKKLLHILIIFVCMPFTLNSMDPTIKYIFHLTRTTKKLPIEMQPIPPKDHAHTVQMQYKKLDNACKEQQQKTLITLENEIITLQGLSALDKKNYIHIIERIFNLNLTQLQKLVEQRDALKNTVATPTTNLPLREHGQKIIKPEISIIDWKLKNLEAIKNSISSIV